MLQSMLRRLMLCLAFPLATATWAVGAHASHYEVVSEDDNKPTDGLVQDLRHPEWTRAHYLACFSQYFSTREKWGGYFYGGFVADPARSQCLLQFCSWQMGGKGAPAADIAFAHAGPHMSWAKTTWEGCAGGIKGHWPDSEFKRNQWHRFVTRTWVSPNDPGHSCIGIWLKDLESGAWYHLATTRYPGTINNLGSFFGFQENFAGAGADPVASVDLRNTYALRGGKWMPYNKVVFRPQGAGDKQERLSLGLIDQGATVSLKTLWSYTNHATSAQKEDPTFKPESQALIYQQPVQPVFFDPVNVSAFSAGTCGDQLHVKWDFANVSCPQLGYKLEIFSTPVPQGDPIMVLSDNDPECRSRLLDMKGGVVGSVRLTVTDIYGVEGLPKAVRATTQTLQPAAGQGSQAAGLNYRYFEAPANVVWDQLPDFATLTPMQQGAVAVPDVSPRLRRENYALDFTGALNIDTDGLYDFTLVHASAGRLLIDGRPVVDASQYHSIGRYSGVIPLAKGRHLFRLQYVQGKAQLQQKDDFLQLRWSGPGCQGVAVPVPSTVFSRPPDSSEPCITAIVPSESVGGRMKLSAVVSGLASQPYRIRYYLSVPTFDYFGAQGAMGGEYFIGESTATDGMLETPLFSTSDMRLRARLIYGDHRTMDSDPVAMPACKSALGPWSLTSLEHHQYPAAANVTGESVAMFGESMALLTQPVTGDCTLTAHLAEITPGIAGPDGSVPDGSQWQAGVILRNDLRASPGEPLGGNTHYAALLGAVDGSIRHCDSLMKNGAGNQPSGNLGGKKRWMRLERKGKQLTESLSEDGVAWSVVKAVELPKLDATIHAGLFIYALPSSINLLHRAVFDHVTLTRAGQ